MNAALQELGFITWFDEQRMRGNVAHQMANGIDNSQVVLVFVTKRYLLKVDGAGARGDNDNCKFEFEYACNRKGVEKMLSVVMEADCTDTSSWQGIVGGRFGSRLYYDFSSDDALDTAVKQIADALEALGVKPSAGPGQQMDTPVQMEQA